MTHFQQTTRTANAAEYLNRLDNNTLVIYSPTSLAAINLINTKVHMIDSRIFGRSVVFIEALSKSKRKYDVVVSLGGGTATDVAKYIAAKSGARFTCIPSMLSTNAYATNKVALVVEDEKVTLDAKAADDIILDISLIQTAPQQNLYGLADIFSIHTALKDWRLADTAGAETVDESVYTKAQDLLAQTVAFVNNTDVNQISYSIPTIYRLVGESGHITNMYGSGRPESGSEHIFARRLEKYIEVPHGVSVSIGIALMSILQDNYSDQIISCIKKINTLHNLSDNGIKRELLERVLLDLHPRKDRYSILDSRELSKNEITKLLDTFSQKLGLELK